MRLEGRYASDRVRGVADDDDATDRGALGRLIDCFDSPAYVITGVGVIVCANRAARRLHPEPPAWLGSVVRDGVVTVSERLAAASRIAFGGRTLWLVLPRANGADERLGAALVAGLPPSLRPVAELLLAGFSEREIAEHTGLTPSSARTYVARVYRRLGVRSRGELLRMALGAGAGRR